LVVYRTVWFLIEDVRLVNNPSGINKLGNIQVGIAK